MKQKMSNLRLPINYNEFIIKNEVEKKIGKCGIVKIDKLSLDCRKKHDIHYVASIIVDAKKNKSKLSEYKELKSNMKELVCEGVNTDSRPVIIGSGPCGMFAGLLLAEQGLRPIIFERGEAVENRRKTVDIFATGGEFSEQSNIQFGEGGAGTFSDGKLNTGINSEYINIVLNEFVKHGANSSILFDAKPHIGTDVLLGVVKSIRERILSLGGEYHFSSKVDDIIVKDGEMQAITVGGIEFCAKNVILACGHSARDTITMLYEKGIEMESKSFAVGMRVEHEQSMLDIAQYGSQNPLLPPSDYKLAHRLDNGKGCFTFCMCPGGVIVPAQSEQNTVVTNGMSEQKRDGKFGNSGVLVGVDPADFGDGVLAGFEFQKNIEKLAYNVGGDYSAPAVLVTDFLAGKVSGDLSNYDTSFTRGLTSCDITKILPKFVTDGIGEGLTKFGTRVKGFDTSGVLIGVESRSSSPVRVLRDECGMSNVRGLYPSGEGAGFAGGITSSAVDGIKTALKLIEKLKTI